ncbi:MAG: hypothetical protein IVW51_05785 [Thermaceae bacterium]|nr:hypothetical protein [Thermaceae bacterium]
MLEKFLGSRNLRVALLVLPIVIIVLAYSAENHGELQRLSLSAVTGLKGVQIPTNFVECLSDYNSKAVGVAGLFGNSGKSDPLFGKLCDYGAGFLKILPAFAYAFIKGFASGFWGIVFSLLLGLFCVATVRDFFRGKVGFGELVMNLGLAILALWLLTLVLIWAFTFFGWLFGFMGTYAAAIIGGAKVWEVFNKTREVRKVASEVAIAAKSVPEEGQGGSPMKPPV